MAEQSYDFVVIGAGIAGLSVAARLAETASVLVLEKEVLPGFHATGRSIATMMPNYGNRSVRKLNRASLPWFHNPDLPLDEPVVSPRGLFVIAQQPDMAKFVQYQDDAYKLQDASTDLLQAATGLAVQLPLQVHWEPEVQDINVHALLTGYQRMLVGRKGHIHLDQPVQKLQRHSNCWQVETTNASFMAKVVVNAAGAWASQIGVMAGASDRGLQGYRRSVATFTPPPYYRLDAPMVMDVGGRFYFKPDVGQIAFSPLEETPLQAGDVFADDYALAQGMFDLNAYFALRAPHFTHTRAGLRTFGPGRTLQIGWDPQIEGLFWLAGQGGYGIQSSPAASAIAVHRLLQLPGPARFGDTCWEAHELVVPSESAATAASIA